MQDKNIEPRNKKGRLHGRFEVYWSKGSNWYKGYAINGKQCGYYKQWEIDGTLNKIKYYAR